MPRCESREVAIGQEHHQAQKNGIQIKQGAYGQTGKLYYRRHEQRITRRILRRGIFGIPGIKNIGGSVISFSLSNVQRLFDILRPVVPVSMRVLYRDKKKRDTKQEQDEVMDFLLLQRCGHRL